MRKNIVFILFTMLIVSAFFIQTAPARANDTKRVYITEMHIWWFVQHTVQPQQLKILNIEGVPNQLAIGIDPGVFRIVYLIPKGATERDAIYVYIWITPHLDNGEVTCSITQFEVGDQLFAGKLLTQPNPYLSNLDATSYCNIFLFPFLKGYGSGSRVATMKLQNNMVWLDIGGTIAPDAPPPVVVDKCEVYVDNWGRGGLFNLRSAPSLDAPVLKQLEEYEDGFLLGWKGDWIKIDVDGVIGWISKEYAYGGIECVPDYFGVSYRAWE